jgi:hypothetical protein
MSDGEDGIVIAWKRYAFALINGYSSEEIQLNLLNACKVKESNLCCKHWNSKMA